jgi:DNA integrity scanning protein DisA with diadenylate cyclase activity
MTLKAREVRVMLKGKAPEEVSHCIEMLAEEQTVIKMTLVELAQSIDQITNIVTDFVQVAENMKSVSDKVNTMMEPEDDLTGPTT